MWNANPEADLAGYIVQYGTQSGNPSSSVDVGNTTNRQFTGLTIGTTYYFRVVAYNATGQQSTASAQVSYTVPSTPPTGPTVTGFSPTSGPIAGGTVITITGTNFVTGATVRVGGASATSVTLLSSTQIRATTPAGTAGGQTVQVTSGGVPVTAPGAFTYTSSTGPTITSVSPNSGPTAGGTTFTITGTNFVLGSGGEIRVGGVMATGIAYISSTQLRGNTPAGTAGARDVLVRNPNGVTATLTGGFTYTGTGAAPTLTSVSPTSGPTAGGTTITLTGTNFVSGATVRVGGTTATGVTFVSATQLSATTPAGTAGARDVQITNPSGQSATRTGGFTYTAPAATPTLTSVSPTSGPTAGGTTISLTGANFASGATVRVGGTAATNVTFLSATQVTAITPSGTAGARDVQITNPTGQSATLTNAFTYTAPASTPTLTAVSPASGPTGGGTTITLTGTNFVSGATVRVGGTAATNVSFVSATQVTARTPTGTAGARDVQITNPDSQSATRTGGFTYTSSTSPTITSVSPSSGPASGGTNITIVGANYILGSGGEIRVGGRMCSNIQYINSTQLRATTPNGTVGAQDVYIRNPNGQTVTLTGGFTYTSGSSLTTLETDAAAASLDASADAARTAPPTGTFRRYLAEGIVTDQMSTRLALANPAAADAHVVLTFATAAGVSTRLAVEVPARARRTVDLSTVPELMGASFSTIMDADQDVALDRLVTWDARGLAASLEAAVDQPSRSWYFAEGSTADPYELFYLVQNPGETDAKVRVRYLLPGGGAPVVRSYTVAAGSRATIWVDREASELAATEVAAEITSLTPIVVERTVYLKDAGAALPRGGDTSTGATAPGTAWFLEGATGPFATRLLIANPGAEAAQVQATYQLQDGTSLITSHLVAANSRATVDVAAEHASLANASVDITLASSAPVVVERTMSWGANGAVDDTMSGSATAAGGARWLLAEGELGGSRQASTSLAVVNQGAATNVTVTLLFEDGPEASTIVAVGAGAHVAVPLGQAFPMAAGRRFSILVEGSDPSASLVVDRAIFWQAVGEARTAGADGAATRLR